MYISWESACTSVQGLMIGIPESQSLTVEAHF